MPRPSKTSAPPLEPIEKTVVAGALVVLLTALWCVGGATPWAPPLILSATGVFAAVTIIVARATRARCHPQAFIPLGLFILYTGISLLNPSHLPIDGGAGGWEVNPDRIRWLPATIDLPTTFRALLPWLIALTLGGVLQFTELSRRAVRIFWGVLLANGLLLALAGVYFFLTDRGNLLGVIPLKNGYHFASFPYRNHWGACVVLLVGIGLGFSFSALAAAARRRGKLEHAFLGIAIALVIALTLPLPGSRSGMILAGLLFVSAVATLVYRFFKWPGLSVRQRAVRVILVLALTAVPATVGIRLSSFRLGETMKRTSMNFDPTQTIRWSFTKDTVKMASDRPWLGWGVGSYPLVFPMYQGDYLRDKNGEITAAVRRAHNDWAHLWSELGVVGLLLLVVPAVRVFIGAWRASGQLGRWGLAGCFTVALYALADFPFHNPAVLALWTCLLCSHRAPEKPKPEPAIA